MKTRKQVDVAKRKYQRFVTVISLCGFFPFVWMSSASAAPIDDFIAPPDFAIWLPLAPVFKTIMSALLGLAILLGLAVTIIGLILLVTSGDNREKDQRSAKFIKRGGIVFLAGTIFYLVLGYGIDIIAKVFS